MKIINNFINKSEQLEIIDYSKNCYFNKNIKNKHIEKINSYTNGWSILHDITKTPISNEISVFQGDSTIIETVPNIFYNLSKKITSSLEISDKNIFFQYVFIGKNGKVFPHYDAGKPGFVTYKCNICVSGPNEDYIHVGKEKFKIKNLDLYAFEANMYKHWMEEKEEERIHLSYGFILPYEDLKFNENDARIRLSNRIWKFFQKSINN